MEVLFQTGSVVHRLPEAAAVLLAENLRAWPIDGDVSRSAADKIERFLTEEATHPVAFVDDERVTVRKALEVLMAGPYDSPELREFSKYLGIDKIVGS
jgi:hypothetical protein